MTPIQKRVVTVEDMDRLLFGYYLKHVELVRLVQRFYRARYRRKALSRVRCSNWRPRLRGLFLGWKARRILQSQNVAPLIK